MAAVPPLAPELIQRIQWALEAAYPDLLPAVTEGIAALAAAGEVTTAAVAGVLIDAGIPAVLADFIAGLIVVVAV